MPTPTLETERLILRAPVEGDLEGWTALDMDARAVRFIGGSKTRADAWRGLAAVAGMWTLRGASLFSVIEKASSRWIGRIGPWIPEGAIGTEIGWALLPSAWGKGYAVEGAGAAVQWAFDRLGWTDVIHCIDAENSPSIAVAQKLGSKWLRVAREANGKEVQVFGQTRDQWRKRTSAAKDE